MGFYYRFGVSSKVVCNENYHLEIYLHSQINLPVFIQYFTSNFILKNRTKKATFEINRNMEEN